ncbi:uncharacterized protein [Mytilus edulis]|uniref:uncharacterized protein n=1 Tax=Mytilus edulis TaxID=6550 RepID=UPI0039EE1315
MCNQLMFSDLEKKYCFIECKIGYVSKDGLPCMPCSPGRWGKKCVDVCSCQHNERCDIVEGCIEETTMMSENRDGTKPTETTYNTTTANNVLTTEINDVLRLIIYAMGAGSIAVMVALASFCFKYKRKAERFRKSITMRLYKGKSATEGESVSRINESAHDLTNENTTIDNHMLIRIVTSNEHVSQDGRRYSATVDQDYISGSFSFSDESVTDIANGGSLNSYLSMTEVDKHRKLPENITHHSEKISSRNSESIMNSTVQIYGNIQPYTSIPIIPYCDVTEYTQKDKAVSKPMDTD